MGKSSKIRRYLKKDYSATVEFPVEIIGRDGAVRRYSFEDAIRLYQRRIASAEVRYDDSDVVAAERQHCHHRIKQLRRSFFRRYGWPDVAVVDRDEGAFLSAEVAAFLRKCLVPMGSDPETFTFSKLDASDDYTTYFIQPPNSGKDIDTLLDGHFLLYLFEFESGDSSNRRDAFFDLVKMLDGVQLSAHAQVETLVAFFHTHDCGLVLTGSGGVAELAHGGEFAAMDGVDFRRLEDVDDPVEKGMRLLAQGRFQAALSAFVSAYTEQHFRRVGYLGAAVVADQLNDDAEAETATVMGCQYFPGDPALIYHRALNLMRQGEYEAAIGQLDSISEWIHGRSAVRFLMALAHLATGRLFRGQRLLRSVSRLTFRLDPHLGRGVRWVRAQIWARNLLSAIVAGGGLGLAVLGQFGVLGVVAIFLVSVFGIYMIFKSWKRQLLLQVSGPGERRMQLSSSAVLIHDGATQHPS